MNSFLGLRRGLVWVEINSKEAYKNALRNNPADDETRYNYNESLSEQEEFKVFYSRLTDIVRRYFEDEAKIESKNIDVVEVHDAFSVCELMALSEL